MVSRLLVVPAVRSGTRGDPCRATPTGCASSWPRPLPKQLCQLIEKREPRIELIRDQSLYPPMRHPADFTGDPGFSRTPEQQRAFEEMLDSADALYGIPDVDPAALKRTADANPEPALGAHHGGRGWWPGQGGRARSRAAAADRVHHLRRGARRAARGVRRVRRAGRRQGPPATARTAARPHLERALADAPGLRDDRAGRRPGRDRRRGGAPAVRAGRDRGRHQPAPAARRPRRPVGPHRPDRRDRRPTWTPSC